MMASQRLSGGRAVGAVFLPAAVVALLVCVFLTVLVILLASLIHGAR
jgi:hypothetical protein